MKQRRRVYIHYVHGLHRIPFAASQRTAAHHGGTNQRRPTATSVSTFSLRTPEQTNPSRPVCIYASGAPAPIPQRRAETRSRRHQAKSPEPVPSEGVAAPRPSRRRRPSSSSAAVSAAERPGQWGRPAASLRCWRQRHVPRTRVRDGIGSAARRAHLDRLRAKQGWVVLRVGERCRAVWGLGCGWMAVAVGCVWVDGRDGSDVVRSRTWCGCMACSVLVG